MTLQLQSLYPEEIPVAKRGIDLRNLMGSHLGSEEGESLSVSSVALIQLFLWLLVRAYKQLRRNRTENLVIN